MKNVNGRNYNIITDDDGKASLSVSLAPKSYTVSVSFAGDSNYNNAIKVTAKAVISKATPKLTATKKTFKVKTKSKKVTATLKDNKGKVIKNVKVTLKVKGKTYNAKTNSKGVVTFSVKLTKKGSYKGTVNFAENTYYKSASTTVKITVKK